MEISSFLSTGPHGTECCVAPANGFVRDALDEEGTEALAAGFAALFQLMMAPASPASDRAAARSAGDAAPSSAAGNVSPPSAVAITPAESVPAGTASAAKTEDTLPASPAGPPLVSDSAEVRLGESPDPIAATRGTDGAPAAESAADPVTNRAAEAIVPTAAESAPDTPPPPRRADLFLSERQAEPGAAPSVSSESAAVVPTSRSNAGPEAVPSTADVVTHAGGADQRAADAVSNSVPNPETAPPRDVAMPEPLTQPIVGSLQDAEAAASAASRSAAATGPSVPPPTVEKASATGSRPTGPEVGSAPQTALDAAAALAPALPAEGGEIEPPREGRSFEDREPESWLDSLTGAGSDGMLTIQELAAWQTFGQESGFEQSRRETPNDAPPAGPVRKTADNTLRAIDNLSAAVPGSAAREVAAAVPAVVAQEALTSFTIDEIVSHVRTDESDGVSRVEAQIDPPELGRMWIEITKSAEGVKAHLTVEDPAVWSLLETAAAEMRDSLQNSGVPMTGLTLSLGRDGGSSQSGGHAGDPNGESRRDEDSYATAAGAAPRRARPKRQVDTIV